MNHQKFNLFMNALDDDLLEEAKRPLPPKRKSFYWGAVAAACFFLVILIYSPFHKTTVTAAELISLGYDIYLPENADDVKYFLQKSSQPEIAQAIFSIDGDKYTYEVIKIEEPAFPSDESNLIWNSKGLDLCLLQTDSSVSLNWYSNEYQTQHTLSTAAETKELLNTAREVLLRTGLDLASVPDGATDIQYFVFPYQDLVVAETTFIYQDTLCSYRQAAALETENMFTDISELEGHFQTVIPGSVAYCSAKLSFNPDGSGKIIWSDIVPGIIYSFSMDNHASEEFLFQLANDLFVPAQGDSE